VGQPFILHVAEHYASTIALCDGRLAVAEQAAERSREWGRLLTGRDPSGIYGVQMFSIRREQGRLAELAPAVRMLAREDDPGDAWRPGLVALLAELEMYDEVQRELDGFRERGLAELREGLWAGSLSYLADGCTVVQDAVMAEILYEELAPLRGLSMMIGHGVACYGATDRYLGMLAATMGDRRQAAEHFEEALQLNHDMGARTFLAHTAYQYGRMLATGASGGRTRADELLRESAALAGEIGMPGLLGKIRALGAPMRLVPTLPDDLSAREAEVIRLVARGMSNREIGAELFISEHTVANHMRSVLRKTGSANRTEVASYAHLRGLADPGSKE
jgi:DNA-binding CsgD family transcriptional regulator